MMFGRKQRLKKGTKPMVYEVLKRRKSFSNQIGKDFPEKLEKHCFIAL